MGKREKGIRSCDISLTEVLTGSLQNLAPQETKKLASMVHTNQLPAREATGKGF